MFPSATPTALLKQTSASATNRNNAFLFRDKANFHIFNPSLATKLGRIKKIDKIIISKYQCNLCCFISPKPRIPTGILISLNWCICRQLLKLIKTQVHVSHYLKNTLISRQARLVKKKLIKATIKTHFNQS